MRCLLLLTLLLPGCALLRSGPSKPEPPFVLVRGGSFRSPQEQLTTFTRASTLRDVRSETIGFRCVRDPG